MITSPSPSESTTEKPPFFVALDVPTTQQALDLVAQLKPYVGGFKVGLELFCSTGPQIVEQIGAREIFLDLKFHDIPNTVRGASLGAAKLGVKIFNVHCLGGFDMMRAAADAAHEAGTGSKVIGVTVLTSHDRPSLARLGLDEEPQSAVRRLARLAQEAGLDGVVCSAQEIEAVRAECGPDFVLVTPGIRPAGAALGDQKRVMTPREAIEAGATWLVVGRPITAAPNPAEVARTLFD
ncbi:MAG TPA: orotidine-5'-phosphate decarboxylase [Abditibacteriaceae bacterium]|jgi:orotidine-5'-phosphate decarboxylase